MPFEHGVWTEDDYLALQAGTSRIVELSDGRIEVSSMASPLHQRIVRFLFRILEAVVAASGAGEAFFAPLPVRLGPGKYRDPDIAFFKPGRIADPRRQPNGADLVIEVVSEEEADRQRDYVTKARNMRLRVLPNTGSSIRRLRRYKCLHLMAPSTVFTASLPAAQRPYRSCCQALPSTWARSLVPAAERINRCSP